MKRSINRTVGLVFGAVYVLVGLLGFTVSGGHDAAGHEGGLLLGIFEVNALHNIAHLLIGGALIIASRATVTASRVANGSVGAAYLLLAALGPFIGGEHSLNILALNGADNALHAASALALLGVAILADRRVRDRELAGI